MRIPLDTVLFSNDKDTNFESNSQQARTYYQFWLSCFRMTKIQILKAIHNCDLIFLTKEEVVFE